MGRQMSLTQFESVPVQEISYSSYYPYYRRSDPSEAIATVAGLVTLATLITLAMIYWGVVLWRLPMKAGYKGAAQWMWFLLLYFPLTGGLALFAFVFAPWPVKKQLEKSEGQLEELRRSLGQG